MDDSTPDAFVINDGAMANRETAEFFAKGFAGPAGRQSWAECAKWIYRKWRAQRQLFQGGGARVEEDLGYAWTNHVSDLDGEMRWQSHTITKTTAKKVFIKGNWNNHRQVAVARAAFESGRAWSRNTRRFYYNERAKSAEQAVYEECERKWGRRNQSMVEDRFPLLGLSAGFTTKDVLRAFRLKSHELHPDHGGTDEMFRDLLDERTRALRLAA